MWSLHRLYQLHHVHLHKVDYQKKLFLVKHVNYE